MNDMYIAYSWLVVSVAGFAGFWLWLHYRHRDRNLGRSADIERLEATVDALQSELESVATDARGQIEQLETRLDFAERLLTSKTDRDVEVSRPARIPTPV